MLFFKEAAKRYKRKEESKTRGKSFFPFFLFSCIFSLPLIISACGNNGEPALRSAPIPIAPTGVAATARDSNNLIAWAGVRGAASYNIYWSTTTGVNKTNGTKIAGAYNPQVHTGLMNGTLYYYVVTAVSAGGEGAESVQVDAMPVAVVASPDPLYGDQWHLKNTGQLGATGAAGLINEDIKVEPVWLAAVTPRKGTGVRIAVVDDGLEIGHEDLASNVAANSLHYNYLNPNFRAHIGEFLGQSG